ncbi:hypothetical protein M3Y99_00163000 [Aphelenchoides fujianensis]|nr:hypothetical protein M3Y99_00163000 [Aphelenchoides fujianensis]
MSSTGLKAVITGGTSGIGLHTLKRLCRSGSFDHIIGIGRDGEKIRLAEENLRSELPASDTKVDFLQCDFARPAAVRSLAADIRELVPRIDVLVNNAGIMEHPPAFTEDGVEIHFAVNHLSHFLLTTLLLDHMAEDGRVINITSGFYKKFAEIPCLQTVHELSAPQFTPKEFYAQSKLANCLFTVALHNHVQQSAAPLPKVKVVAVRPGFIRGTDLGRFHNPWLRWAACPLIWLFSQDLNFVRHEHNRPPRPCFVCLKSRAAACYYDQKLEEYYSELVTEEAAEQLWNLSESLLQNKIQRTTRQRQRSNDTTITDAE